MNDLRHLRIEHNNWTDPAGLFWSTIGLPDGLYVIPAEPAAGQEQSDDSTRWVLGWLWGALFGLALALIVFVLFQAV